MKNDGFLAEVELLLNGVLGGSAGSERLVDICQRYSGSLVYIPSKTALQLHLRNEEIRSKFRGDNYLELAASYGLAYSRIWTIINEARNNDGPAEPAEGGAEHVFSRSGNTRKSAPGPYNPGRKSPLRGNEADSSRSFSALSIKSVKPIR